MIALFLIFREFTPKPDNLFKEYVSLTQTHTYTHIYQNTTQCHSTLYSKTHLDTIFGKQFELNFGDEQKPVRYII